MRAEYLQCPQRNDSDSGRVEAFSGWIKFQSMGKTVGKLNQPSILPASESQKGDKAEMLLLLLV